jgi:predicted MPP superfamily phosphohydrolase
LNRLYHGGEYDVGNEHPRRMIVSHGVGCSALPLRIFTPPEVHLCLIT